MNHLKQLPRRAFGYSMLILILLVASTHSIVRKARTRHRRDDSPAT